MDTSTQKYVLKRLLNRLTTAEGNNLPPRRTGATRVPLATNVKLLRSTSLNFVVTWNEPVGQNIKIDHYNLFLFNNNASTYQAQQVSHVTRAPGLIYPPILDPNIVYQIVVQTVLGNGMSSDLSVSPSISGRLLTP